MRRLLSQVAASLVIALLATLRSQAAQEVLPSDSTETRQNLDRARKSAGQDWSEAFSFICATNPNRANRPDDPEIEPAKVFDNLYVMGRSGTAVWAITTSAGIVLIDSGYQDQLDSVLLPAMKKVGLDPAQVKYVFLGHGHADHFGGTPYFQDHGAHVVLTAPDWDGVEHFPQPGGGAPPLRLPKRDIVAAEGQPISVGDVTFTPVMIPGHTAGTMGLIFPVKDGRTTRIAGLFGGAVLTPSRVNNEEFRQYIDSVAHWGVVTKQMKVEVELQNHPLFDGFLEKLQRLRSRKAGDPNPFVVGPEPYQRFLSVMSDCSKVQLARRLGA